MSNFDRYLSQLHWPSVTKGVIATVVLAALIVIGSRDLADFDAALVGYTFASLFSLFGIAYRYSVWLTKPPTRQYWRRGWQLLFMPSTWRLTSRVMLFLRSIWSQLIFQDFVLRRGTRRWIGHILIVWGSLLAFAITFPLVFGWIHFEQGAVEPEPTYNVIFFGFHVSTLPLQGILSWLVFHALVISSFMVLAGLGIVILRRLFDMGAVAVERFGRDFLPLIMLFAISASGLLLWASYEWFNGQFYNALATFHAITVIAFLVYLPFGKLFHIFQRPASLGIVLYHAVGEMGEQTVCPVTDEAFASRMQTNDLKQVLPELGFDYTASDPENAAVPVPSWNEISPKGRRMLIARAHNSMRNGRFD